MSASSNRKRSDKRAAARLAAAIETCKRAGAWPIGPPATPCGEYCAECGAQKPTVSVAPATAEPGLCMKCGKPWGYHSKGGLLCSGNNDGTRKYQAPAATPEPGPCAMCGHIKGDHGWNVSGGKSCRRKPCTCAAYLDPSTRLPKPATLPEPDAVLLVPSTDTTLAACDWWYYSMEWHKNENDIRLNQPVWRAKRAAVKVPAGEQATDCAGCGERKNTPLRNDAMGGYVCLTCINRELIRLQAIARQSNQPPAEIRREAAAADDRVRFVDVFAPEPPALPPRPADLSALQWYELGDVLTDCRLPKRDEWYVRTCPEMIQMAYGDHEIGGGPKWIVARNPRPTVAGWEFKEFRPRYNNRECCWNGTKVIMGGNILASPVWIAVREPSPVSLCNTCTNGGDCILNPDDKVVAACEEHRKPAPVPAVTLEEARNTAIDAALAWFACQTEEQHTKYEIAESKARLYFAAQKGGAE